ncbi:GSU2403 family nucleotidyltransferase fold protein [Aquabacterium sp.]|uniref:GSU2403 family nucleotidyltransferase fold protein n=1 Tax=Aquabacterium sp. TaxID=1872578 RepID=UPI0027B8B4F4|nr:GSU2403 family nucleotidyltransferase fold protein [Aquabacterium sp.]
MLIELSESQTRQQLDASSVFTALLEARAEAAVVRGSMIWREIDGRRYLIRTSTAGAQKSLGPESSETQAIAARFLDRKEMAAERLKQLTEQVVVMQRMNRALRVGRVPNVVVDTLNTLEKAGIGEHFLVVGTHALYAYESAAGVRIPDGAMATRDVDLFFDTRKGVKLFSSLGRLDSSMIALLQKVDKTFRVRHSSKYTAVNAAGFEVDIIRRVARDGDPHPLRMSDDEDDLWAAQVPSGDNILGARPFEEVVVATSGAMARMRTIHPLDFARIKERLSKATDRDPLKARKDALQASVAREIVRDYLPQLA